MKTSSLLNVTLALIVLSLSQAFAKTPAGWTDDYAKALEKAKAEKKLVLLDFTGSDWCGWCMKLDKEIFDKGAFKGFAQDKLVLVKVDFPHSTPIAKNTKEQNEKLSQQFGIRGYPTLYIIDPEGKKLWQGGYMEGGPNAFIKAVSGVFKKKE